MSEPTVYRILALGRSETLDRMTACLSGAGYAMLQLSNPASARRLLELGSIDAVVADGNAEGLAELLSEDSSERPWLLLGPPAAGPLPEGRATALAANTSSHRLCNELARHLRARPGAISAGASGSR